MTEKTIEVSAVKDIARICEIRVFVDVARYAATQACDYVDGISNPIRGKLYEICRDLTEVDRRLEAIGRNFTKSHLGAGEESS